MKLLRYIGVAFFIASASFAQWTSKWSSYPVTTGNVAGWFPFKYDGSKWEERFYEVNPSSFVVFDGTYSSTREYVYNFTSAENKAGNQIYSLGYDLTGDGIVEFYVLAYYGSSENYRQAFKIIDITNGAVLFERNEEGYYFTYPVVWDADNDGTLECTFAKYDYPNYETYTYEVYSTGIPTSTKIGEPVKLNFSLKQNYPNPFNPSTVIEYSVQKAGNVHVRIFDSKGELIKNLFSGHVLPGVYKLKWNGRNDFGEKVSSGTYFYQLTQDGKAVSKKMLLIK